MQRSSAPPRATRSWFVNRRALRQMLVLIAVASTALTPLAAQFGRNKFPYESFRWQVYRSPHFDIHYYPEMEPFLEDLVSYAESAYLKISRDLDFELRFRVPLIAYKTHGEFEQTNITMAELPEAVGAFAEPVQNRMVLPIDLPPDKLYALIAHELVHIFQYALFFEGNLGRTFRSAPPAWLMEGMASYLADDEDNFDRMAIRDAVVNNVLPPLERLNVVTFLTYRYGHAVFDFIEEEHGLEGVRNFIFEYRKVLLTNNVAKAIKEALGYEVDEFDRRFNRFLRRKYLPVLLEKKSPDDYGTEIGIRRPGVYTFSPTLSPSGELVAALASPTLLDLDLVVLSADDGKLIENVTSGWSNRYRGLVAEAFSGKRDLAWSPSGDEVAVFARRENAWPLVIYDAIRGKRLRDIELSGIVECASPAYSPDGMRIAFEGNRDGTVDIFEVDLASGAIRNLTADDFFDANPWYAPDGRTLLYNRRIGEHWKIFSVDLDDSTRKTQLTFGGNSDLQPAYSRDGSTIYFSSDRGTYGVFNIHSLDVASGDIAQYTDVVGGCFSPVEMAEREGKPFLAYTAYFEGTFRLYRMALNQPESRLTVTERLADVVEAEPFVPPLTLRTDESAKSPYRLRWDIEAPFVSIGVTDDGTFLGDAALQFSDLLGDHRVQLLASAVSSFSTTNLSYLNLKRRLQWGASLYDYRDYYLRESRRGLIERDQSYRQTGANVFLRYPLGRHYRLEGSLGAMESSQDRFAGFSPEGIPFFTRVADRYLVGTTALVGDTTRYQEFGPFQGKRFRLQALFAPHLSGDSDGDWIEYRGDFRAYKQATRRSSLALRVASVYNNGDRESLYGFGGVNQLRGFGFREFFGSRMAWANLEFRYPLLDELRFPVVALTGIRGFFFVDAGAAWLDDDQWYDPDFVRTDGFRGGIRVDPTTGQPVPFSFWDSDESRLQDGRASYGTGFQFFFIGGLQFNWAWAKRLDYTQVVCDTISGCVKTKANTGGWRSEFYIVYDF